MPQSAPSPSESSLDRAAQSDTAETEQPQSDTAETELFLSRSVVPTAAPGSGVTAPHFPPSRGLAE